MSSAWALASAGARAATDSLDRGMASLRLEDIKTHGTCVRALASHAVTDRLLGILGHQGFELAFRTFVVEKGLSAAAEQGCKLGPRIRRAHIHDADGLDARPRRLGVNQVGCFS